MNQNKHPVNHYDAYHAHVYFDENTSAAAKILCDAAHERHDLKVGRFHEKLVGPHPCWSCQISFGAEDFDTFIPWLEESRAGLTIFIHPLSEDFIKDHTELAYWLGQEVELNLAFFETLKKS
jgi:DOPA 4,5-dioxygenase